MLIDLKIAGLISQTVVSFSNAFFEHTDLYNMTRDKDSYVMFGGYNASQIIGGEKGLFNLPMIKAKYNPTFYWGVEAWGFAYGDDIMMDP